MDIKITFAITMALLLGSSALASAQTGEGPPPYVQPGNGYPFGYPRYGYGPGYFDYGYGYAPGYYGYMPGYYDYAPGFGIWVSGW
jgi:hypothetical protein